MLLHKNHKFIYDNLATGTLQFHTVPHRATPCHTVPHRAIFSQFFAKIIIFSPKNKVFLCTKKDRTRVLSFLYFLFK